MGVLGLVPAARLGAAPGTQSVPGVCNERGATPGPLDDANHPRYLLQWLSSRKGKLSSTVAEAVIHWRSDPSMIGPDVQIYFAPVYFWEHGFRKTGTPAKFDRPPLRLAGLSLRARIGLCRFPRWFSHLSVSTTVLWR